MGDRNARAIILILASLLLISQGVMLSLASSQDEELPVQRLKLVAGDAGDLSAPQPLSRAQVISLYEKLLEGRLAVVRRAKEAIRQQAGGGTLPRPAVIEEGDAIDLPPWAGTKPLHDSPQVRSNTLNTIASSVSRILAEPAVAAEGNEAFYTGNTYASYSTDRGAIWTKERIKYGPLEAPYACCDQTVIHDRSHGVTFWSVLYLNTPIPQGASNGVVRIFVRRSISQKPNCAYQVDPGGDADNVLPDYPQIGLSNNFVYLTTNDRRYPGNTWAGADVYRINASQMANCATADATLYHYTGRGRPEDFRVFVPVTGAQTTMYWGMFTDLFWSGDTIQSRAFRLFSWRETASSPRSTAVAVGLVSHFSDPACYGGVGNYDWLGSDTYPQPWGFDLRGAAGGGRVSFIWPVGPDSPDDAPVEHIHTLHFSQADRTVLDEYGFHVSSSDIYVCAAYPAISINSRSDTGITLAYGGNPTGYIATRAGVALWHGVRPIFPFYFYRASTGTHNPSDGRFGDYFTVGPSSACPDYWVAANYALLNGNTKSKHVDARFVEFGPQEVSCP